MKCSCCGAPINYNSYGEIICAYCGNTELNTSGRSNRNCLKNFEVAIKVNKREVKRLDNDSQRQYGENIRKELINKLAEGIADAVETFHYEEEDIRNLEVYTICKGRIVVEFMNY